MFKKIDKIVTLLPHRSLLQRKGETLIEVLISLSVLMIVIAPVSALNFQSTRNRAFHRNYSIAAGLAKSGLGMMQNIRDTNLLRFSPKAQQCWNTKPSHTDLANCEVMDANPALSKVIAAGSYTIGDDTADPFLPITLELQTTPLDSADPRGEIDQADLAASAGYELKLDEDLTSPGCDMPSLPQGTPCHAHFVDDTHLYNHKKGQAGGFYREIKIEYPSAEPFMVVTSTVVFRDGSKFRTVTLAQGLYDISHSESP